MQNFHCEKSKQFWREIDNEGPQLHQNCHIKVYLNICYHLVSVSVFLFAWWCITYQSYNATFNNTSILSWQSVLLVEETRVTRENNRPVASHWQTLSNNVVHLALIKIRTDNISDDRLPVLKDKDKMIVKIVQQSPRARANYEENKSS